MTKPTVVSRITKYLATGGLFNPEMADHNAVRDLLLDAREALIKAQGELRQYGRSHTGALIDEGKS